MAIGGESKRALMRTPGLSLREPAVAHIAGGAYLSKGVANIRGSGYCVASLEAALWCFHGTDSFEDAVLAAANLGDDADTTAAITGQLAGAHYGIGGIPPHWLERVWEREKIQSIGDRLYRVSLGEK
jgi:ADP-ribosyl-[dinitrogen reductase] hydrolase